MLVVMSRVLGSFITPVYTGTYSGGRIGVFHQLHDSPTQSIRALPSRCPAHIHTISPCTLRRNRRGEVLESREVKESHDRAPVRPACLSSQVLMQLRGTQRAGILLTFTASSPAHCLSLSDLRHAGIRFKPPSGFMQFMSLDHLQKLLDLR